MSPGSSAGAPTTTPTPISSKAPVRTLRRWPAEVIRAIAGGAGGRGSGDGQRSGQRHRAKKHGTVEHGSSFESGAERLRLWRSPPLVSARKAVRCRTRGKLGRLLEAMALTLRAIR